MILTGAAGTQGVDLPVSSLNLLRKEKLQMQQELDTMGSGSALAPVDQERQRHEPRRDARLYAVFPQGRR